MTALDPLDPLDPDVWQLVRATVGRARRSALHCSIATIAPDGTPHLTPIGSLAAGAPGQASYLDVFNVQLGRNLDRHPACTALAVDAGRATWVRALVRGSFERSPAVRLLAVAGPSRPATDAEIERFQRSVRPALRTRGGRTMWGHPERMRARDLTVTGVLPVRIPRMTPDVRHLART